MTPPCKLLVLQPQRRVAQCAAQSHDAAHRPSGRTTSLQYGYPHLVPATVPHADNRRPSGIRARLHIRAQRAVVGQIPAALGPGPRDRRVHRAKALRQYEVYLRQIELRAICMV